MRNLWRLIGDSYRSDSQLSEWLFRLSEGSSTRVNKPASDRTRLSLGRRDRDMCTHFPNDSCPKRNPRRGRSSGGASGGDGGATQPLLLRVHAPRRTAGLPSSSPGTGTASSRSPAPTAPWTLARTWQDRGPCRRTRCPPPPAAASSPRSASRCPIPR